MLTLDRSTVHLFTADSQTAGVGTRGKKWVTPIGKNLSFTLVCFFDEQTPQLAESALLFSGVIATVLEQYGFKLTLKWPNDLVYDGRKVAGVLVEVKAVPGQYALLVGVGINVNATMEELASIDQPATSLSLIGNREIDREELQKNLVKSIVKALEFL